MSGIFERLDYYKKMEEDLRSRKSSQSSSEPVAETEGETKVKKPRSSAKKMSTEESAARSARALRPIDQDQSQESTQSFAPTVEPKYTEHTPLGMKKIRAARTVRPEYLTDDRVLECLEDGKSFAKIAKEFQTTIHHVKKIARSLVDQGRIEKLANRF